MCATCITHSLQLLGGGVCPILYTLNIVNNCKRRTFARVPKSLANKILISYVYFNDSHIVYFNNSHTSVYVIFQFWYECYNNDFAAWVNYEE